MNRKYTQDELNKTLWAAADSARSNVDAGVYKDYALTILFFKYLSDLNKRKYEEYKERYGEDETRIEEKMKLDRFYLPPNSSFDYIYSKIEEDNIGEEINKVLHRIEDANKDKLEGVFSVDFNSESILGKLQQRNKMLRDLIQDFAKIDLSEADDDIIGNSYMYMIGRFGADAGKKAGEFFTVKSVAHLVAMLSEPEEGDRICDPACGSGGLLLLAGEEVEKQGSDNYALYGQESTGSTYQLARMNMFLHGKDSARLEWGDTLNNPQLVEDDQLMKFDRVIANPPFSLKKWGAENAESDPYNRFWRGVPPTNKGDYAFISHMIETAKPKSGKVVVIVPHGVLFRGSVEGKIRKQLLEENIIDTVIGLPAGLFQTTGIPVAILVIDRSREKGGVNENKKDVLFIEASKEYKDKKAQNELAQENIDKIFTTYKERKDIEKFARVVQLDEIKENDFNLNITRYVDTFEEEEPVDIEANLKALAELEPELERLEKQMREYLKELGIK
ncbi:type I restriction-modification system subunit M [candidate division WWE3 bacterium CG22_combo_CG10-13_8_21_14_all_39_12]|uniref:site-specific DNA-methyltransferase (adenine-specific) n=1 Tax=candidate division WWE3 bacterium CG22_combo_CG10-13_8_21_14_all_39_12 TaxID=1975094 RepID=A0A2H0BEX7_UNCKA|nr:MAG: type I restriction-modification system subunit M [candidate division WWE3 bacterium CG22_combo_CG10-13_8_21_14_all_39_12]